MTIDIVPYGLSDETQQVYDVNCFDEEIHTTLTHTPSTVESWISDTERINRRHLHNLIVGLDVEWRPTFGRNIQNPVATLQLCVGQRCLIFQFIHAPYIPQSLHDFLGDPNFTFVGVGIESDAVKLSNDYDLMVSNTFDLADLAARKLCRGDLGNAGLKALARAVLGKEMEKPMSVTTSHWDRKHLSLPQIKYACIDAFVSFEIGRSLNASSRPMYIGTIY